MSFLSGMKFRIGTKLAITAGFGVVMVTAMVANQIRVNASSATLSAQASSGEAMLRAIITAEVALRRTIIMNRDIRMAVAAPAINQSEDRLRQFVKDGQQALDRAIPRAVMPETREQLVKSKQLFDSYAAMMHETAAVQREAVDLLLQQSAQGLEWGKKFAEFMALQGFSGEPKRAELVRALEHSDSAFKQARLAYWAYLAVRKDDQPPRIEASLKQAETLYKTAQSLMSDEALKKASEPLSGYLPQYRDVIVKSLKVLDRQVDIMKKADPIRIAFDDVLAKVKTAEEARAVALEEEAAAQQSNAATINIAGGVLVVLLLIGSAIFSSLTIARPIRRIGQVLLELANGNKQVDVPYAGRGDEVGDAARAAQTFKEGIARMERMEAEQKEAEARAAVQRKADMHRLADEFQAAVGGIVDTVSSASAQLESAASTLTQTAEQTQDLSGEVAAASEQASANVQSVASATEELSLIHI